MANETPCSCCPYCGALPGHQNPPTGEVWQHKHSPARDQVMTGPEAAAYYQWLKEGLDRGYTNGRS